jgi:hypothetical protein
LINNRIKDKADEVNCGLGFYTLHKGYSGSFGFLWKTIPQFQPLLQFNTKFQVRGAYQCHVLFWRPYRLVETPVPIPNTVVKHLGPMIVRVLAKVGIAIFINPLPGHLGKGFF